MLHNSLFRREWLRTMNGHPLVVARREVHRDLLSYCLTNNHWHPVLRPREDEALGGLMGGCA